MKKYLLLLLVFNCIHYVSNAQNYTTDKIVDSTNNPDKFLFSDYSSGIVFLKNGNRVEAKLNYQMDNQSFYYLDDSGKPLELNNVDDIDTIFAGDMKFIPIEKKFYYVIVKSNISLLGSFFGKPMPIGYSYDISGLKMKEAGETSGDISNANTLMQKNKLSKLKFTVRYYLLDNNKINKVGTTKQIEKYFKNLNETNIKNYLSSNKVDFDKTSSVGKFVQICNEYSL